MSRNKVFGAQLLRAIYHRTECVRKFKVHQTAMAPGSSDHELWGWQNYFQEIARFIGEAERQFGNNTPWRSLSFVSRVLAVFVIISHLHEHESGLRMRMRQ